MKRKGRRSASLWQSIKIDKRLALGLKAVVMLYALAAPFAWRDVAIDPTPVYAVGFALGTLALSVDVTLGLLVLTAVATTMVSIGRQTAAVRADRSRDTAPDFYPAYEKVDKTPLAPVLREGFSSAPPVSVSYAQPDEQPVVPDVVLEETAPEDTVGPKFLLQPDGKFVTEASLAAAQTNRVGPDDVYSPLGGGSYSIQGLARDVPVVPMVW